MVEIGQVIDHSLAVFPKIIKKMGKLGQHLVATSLSLATLGLCKKVNEQCYKITRKFDSLQSVWEENNALVQKDKRFYERCFQDSYSCGLGYLSTRDCVQIRSRSP